MNYKPHAPCRTPLRQKSKQAKNEAGQLSTPMVIFAIFLFA
jgi:hypothetical protein